MPAPRAHHLPRSRLRERDQPGVQAGNGADPLRYIFIVSQVDLVASAAAAAAADHSAASEAEGLGQVTVGIARARGSKCQRCGDTPFSRAPEHITVHACVPTDPSSLLTVRRLQVLELQPGGGRCGRPPAAVRALCARDP